MSRGWGRGVRERIAGGDVRLFSVKVREAGVAEIPHVAPPARPRGRFLPLGNPASIKEQILARPTFFEHFDGVCVDWRCVRNHERAALAQDNRWLKRQGVRVLVDLSSGIDLYPTLRLMNNIPEDYESSLAAIRDVMDKMESLGWGDLILCLHRQPENNFTGEQGQAALTAALKTLAGSAATHHLTLYLRISAGKPPYNVAGALGWLDRVGSPNLKLAVSTGLVDDKPLSAETRARLKPAVGLWLAAVARRDLSGHLWDDHAPVHSSAKGASLAKLLALCPEAPVLLDGAYASQDEEYLDAAELEAQTRGL